MTFTDRPFREAFIVTPESLTAIAAALRDAIGEPRFELVCKDKLRRDGLDLAQTLAFTNSRTKAIETIRVTAKREDFTHATLKLTDSQFTPIHLSAVGPEELVGKVSDEISDAIDGMIAWYSVITKRDFGNVAFGLFAFTFFSVLVGGSIHRPPH